MKKTLLTIAVLLMASFGYCQNQASNVTYNTKKELVIAFVKAINDKSIVELKQIMHPLCLEGISKDNEDYYEHSFGKTIEYKIPSDYKVSYSRLGSGDVLPLEEYVLYPVRPTWQFQLDYDKTKYNSVSIIRWIVNDNLGWHVIEPQPKPEFLSQFRAVRIKEAERQKGIEQIIQSMDKDLSAKIIQYLKDKRLIDAIQEFQNRSGESLMMSKSVVEEIRKREKLEW